MREARSKQERLSHAYGASVLLLRKMVEKKIFTSPKMFLANSSSAAPHPLNGLIGKILPDIRSVQFKNL